MKSDRFQTMISILLAAAGFVSGCAHPAVQTRPPSTASSLQNRQSEILVKRSFLVGQLDRLPGDHKVWVLRAGEKPFLAEEGDVAGLPPGTVEKLRSRPRLQVEAVRLAVPDIDEPVSAVKITDQIGVYSYLELTEIPSLVKAIERICATKPTGQFKDSGAEYKAASGFALIRPDRKGSSFGYYVRVRLGTDGSGGHYFSIEDLEKVKGFLIEAEKQLR